MAAHNEKGKEGELLALNYLESNGYEVIGKNWTSDKSEIDLIALKDGMLHFIEVKYRTFSKYGHPEQNVTRKKIKFLLRGIDDYLYMHPQHTDFRLDILAITGKEDDQPEYFFIPDVTL
ncbi:MAG: YraN family protein [Candidatus Dadabacteria bacterium]